ncbi:MAG: hypothetical protein FGM26_02740 [Beijerinckiaceae bacterium]|nr:hypothetical protein [Beijerinckiaceae bacterium]
MPEPLERRAFVRQSFRILLTVLDLASHLFLQLYEILPQFLCGRLSHCCVDEILFSVLGVGGACHARAVAQTLMISQSCVRGTQGQR